MASIIKTSIDLTKIDKNKIITGAKGKYLPISLTINDEVDQFGNQGLMAIMYLLHQEMDNHKLQHL